MLCIRRAGYGAAIFDTPRFFVRLCFAYGALVVPILIFIKQMLVGFLGMILIGV